MRWLQTPHVLLEEQWETPKQPHPKKYDIDNDRMLYPTEMVDNEMAYSSFQQDTSKREKKHDLYTAFVPLETLDDPQNLEIDASKVYAYVLTF